MEEPIVSSEATEEKREQNQAEVPAQSETIYNWRFVIILTSLAIASLLTAIESTVTSTALPTISADLNAGEAYIWFVKLSSSLGMYSIVHNYLSSYFLNFKLTDYVLLVPPFSHTMVNSRVFLVTAAAHCGRSTLCSG
jgi:hypothetical protein